jgi:pullulanase
MPWTACKDKSYDWGYSPFQYFAVEYAYANDVNQPAEKISWLKKLVSACHERSIQVIMDGVYNHCDPLFPYKDFYLDPNTCPYTAQNFGGAFPGLQDLDFYNNCTQVRLCFHSHASICQSEANKLTRTGQVYSSTQFISPLLNHN